MKLVSDRHGWIGLLALMTLFGNVAGCGGKGTASPPGSSSGTPKTAPPTASPAPPTPGSAYTFVKPEFVRGIYVTAWSAGGKTSRARLLSMIDRTELNSMVIDIRDDGDMYWDNKIPLAVECKANQHAITKPEIIFADLVKHKVWPIARIACFRDHFVPKKHPEMAVQLENGKAWKDRSGHTWLDPYNRKNWEYLAQTVDYALDQGFPAIQLDYVRFPSEGKSQTQRFPGKDSYPDKSAKPEDVIARFCQYIRKRVKARGAEFSADNFGIISSTTGDQGIGQELEKIAEPFDVMSPMVYPSHFAKGEYGIANPSASPFEIVHHSLNDYKKRLPTKAIRPWLQDFFHYTAKDIREQIRAAYSLGYREYLIWNAGNRFTEAAYKDNSALLKAPPKDAVQPVPKKPLAGMR